ncbi:MAG TPA: CheR family methyltransferase [Gaiellaceae bacterium]|nr:CheR family methyltransferase [Gaiellaceae bacterium]
MAATSDGTDFEQLVEYIRTTRGFDFGGYKRPSLQRRFQKRMQSVHVGSYSEYRLYLEQHPDEFIDLFNTILINVTAFFRDGAAWDYLRQEIVPRIVEESAGQPGIRVWATGCASGEEAYSLAMSFAEAMPSDRFRERVKIYATDVDEEALSEGRHGIYPSSRLDNVPAELRERYFERLEQRYVIKPDLRRAVIFGRHDVVQDPPISRIDLLTSRNTLMYFTPNAQSKILTNFHFALRDGGFLFLGKSEMMLSRSNLFTPVDLRRRLFQKVSHPEAYRPIPRGRPQVETDRPDGSLGVMMREVGFEAAPIAQLVVDRGGSLTLANMQARTLFNLAQRDVGKPLKDLEVSYKPVELRSQVDRAYAERHAISLRDVDWHHPSGDHRVMDVQIAPLVAADGQLVGVGISFVDVTRYKRLQEAVEHSKRDVEVAYEELQSTVEELETTNEELQSTNEELETTNEELQSTNEELETMNEELQSTNEELETINDELNMRTDELDQTNGFLESILGSLDAGVVVLDAQLRINAWNEGAYDLWGLRGDEVQGQHFMNLDIGLPVEKLRTPLRKLLAGESVDQPVTVEATNRRGRSITCRVRLSPLADGDAAPRGAILFMEGDEA